MRCTCGKTMKPIGKIAGEWFYYTCDVCLEEICEGCAIVNDETGEVICMSCYQDAKRMESVNA